MFALQKQLTIGKVFRWPKNYEAQSAELRKLIRDRNEFLWRFGVYVRALFEYFSIVLNIPLAVINFMCALCTYTM